MTPSVILVLNTYNDNHATSEVISEFKHYNIIDFSPKLNCF